MIKVAFIINRSRKLNIHAQQALSLAKSNKLLATQEFETEYEKHATKLAIELAASNDIIVAVGGDGTCNEVVHGIVKSGEKNVGFGIVPNGTGNDFARMFPEFNPENFVKSLEANDGQWIDVGRAVLSDSTRSFANIADVGFGAKVVEIMNRQRDKNLKGKMSYSLAIVRAFFSYKKSVVKIVGDDFEFEGKVLLVAFCNGGIFGHGLTINPDAKIDDGKLGITVIGDISLMTYVRKLSNLKKGRKIEHPEAHYFESKSVRIEKLDSNMAMEGDGELFGKGLQLVEIMPNRIKLVHY